MKEKRAHPPKAQTPRKDRLFLSQYSILMPSKDKIPKKAKKDILATFCFGLELSRIRFIANCFSTIWRKATSAPFHYSILLITSKKIPRPKEKSEE